MQITKHIRRVVTGWLAISVLLLATVYAVGATPLAQSAQQGEAIFKQKCQACHTIGGGTLVGPDLQGVTQARELSWLRDFIARPDQMIASGDPIAAQLLAEFNNLRMPNLGLSQTEVEAVIAFLESAGSGEGGAVAPGEGLPPGEPSRGQTLFTGGVPLENGGVACIACHSATGIAPMGGGTLGPDLTKVISRYGGGTGFASVLAGLPFPTMQGIFVNRPLTPQEQADLLAFFEQTGQRAEQPPVQVTRWLWLGGGLGALVLFAGMTIFWPRQRQSLSERLRRGT